MNMSLRLLLLTTLFTLLLSCSDGKKKGESKAHSSENIKVRLVLDTGRSSDPYFNMLLKEGVLKFYEETKLTKGGGYGRFYNFSELSKKDGDVLATINKFSKEGSDSIIILGGDSFVNYIKQFAYKFARQKYVVVGAEQLFHETNVSNIVLNEHINAYVAGVAIALKAKKDKLKEFKFGFIADSPTNMVNRYFVGYLQGILSIIPDANFYVGYTKSISNHTKSYDIAAKMYGEEGVYAIFSASKFSVGVVEQAKNFAREGYNVWAILTSTSSEHDSGIFEIGEKSVVFTTLISPIDVAIKCFLDDFSKNIFIPGYVKYDLKEGMIKYSTDNESFDEDILNYLKVIEKDIYKEKIKVKEFYYEVIMDSNRSLSFFTVN